MRFFLIIIALALIVYQPQWVKKLQPDGLILKWQLLVTKQSAIRRNRLMFFVLYLLPVIVLAAIVLPLFETVLLGVPYLILAMVLLLFCCGRNNIVKQFVDYSKAWQAGTPAEVLESMGALNAASEDDKTLHLTARARLIYAAFEQLFCVLFWFAAGGLLIPLIYRCLKLLELTSLPDVVSASKQQRKSAFARLISVQHFDQVPVARLVNLLIQIIEFIPAKLVSLAVNIIADKKLKGLTQWRKSCVDLSTPTMLSLHDNATASLQLMTLETLIHVDLSAAASRQDFYQQVTTELNILERSFKRLFMLFFAIAAIWLIFI